jgi:hypothetical protein
MKGHPMDDDRLMTRRELVEFVRRETGIPVTYTRLMKDAAAGHGPPPAALFGKRMLYRQADALAYARSLIRPAQNDQTRAPTSEVPVDRSHWHAAKPRVSAGQAKTPETEGAS